MNATHAISGPRIDPMDRASMPSTTSTITANRNASHGSNDCLRLRLNESKNWRATYVSS